MSMTVEDLKDAVCDLVSIAEEYVDRKYFEELDNKGVAIIDALDEFRELKEKATAKKPKHLSKREGIVTTNYECPICGCRRLGHSNDLDKCYCPECGQKLDWNEGKGVMGCTT